MGRPYGKIKRTPRQSSGKPGGTAFKIRLRGENSAPLSMQEIRDGLYEAARRLQQDENCHRASWVTLYLNMLDKDGKEFLPDPSGAWEISPYKCAADEHGA